MASAANSAMGNRYVTDADALYRENVCVFGRPVEFYSTCMLY